MTSVSPLNAASLFASLYGTGVTKISPATNTNSLVAPPSSTSVTLGQPAAVAPVAPVYALTAAPIESAVWEGPSNHAVTSLMAANFSILSGAGQFQGLGAALLNQLGTDPGNFSQSVLLSDPHASAANIAAAQTQLHNSAPNSITLDVATSSGAKVEITLGSDTNGLAVQVKVTHGTLTAADQTALKGLSKAFQSAIDGLNAAPPTLNLSGLMQFDSSALSSIDFHATVQGESGIQKVDFHADTKLRSLNASGPGGTIKLNVDMSNPAIIGNAQQRANAIGSYLQQFQNEQQRGHGDASLMSMFENAFTDMNSNYSTAGAQSAVSPGLSLLSASDHGMLTGLADFTASVVQTPTQSNPLRIDEMDAFSYQVSQSTDIDSKGSLNLSVEQHQSSHLRASFHQAIPGSAGLFLTKSRQSQTYDYMQIDDSASSDAQIAYEKGELVKATLDQSASQSTHKKEYLAGDLVQEITTPSSKSWSKDFLKLLDDADLASRIGDPQIVDRTQAALPAASCLVPLQADPSRLGLAG
jgi:hypothetical protein